MNTNLSMTASKTRVHNRIYVYEGSYAIGCNRRLRVDIADIVEKHSMLIPKMMNLRIRGEQ